MKANSFYNMSIMDSLFRFPCKKIAECKKRSREEEKNRANYHKITINHCMCDHAEYLHT